MTPNLKGRDFLCLLDYTPEEIAYLIGFNDPLYFSKMFKKRYGVAPSQYFSTSRGDHHPAQDHDSVRVMLEDL